MMPTSLTMQKVAFFAWVCAPILSLASTAYLGTTTRLELIFESAFFSLGVAATAYRYSWSLRSSGRKRAAKPASKPKQQEEVFYYDQYGRRTTREPLLEQNSALRRKLEEATQTSSQEKEALARENAQLQNEIAHLRRASLSPGRAWLEAGEEEAELEAAERAAAERARAEREAEQVASERRFLLKRFTNSIKGGDQLMYDHPSPGVVASRLMDPNPRPIAYRLHSTHSGYPTRSAPCALTSTLRCMLCINSGSHHNVPPAASTPPPYPLPPLPPRSHRYLAPLPPSRSHTLGCSRADRRQRRALGGGLGWGCGGGGGGGEGEGGAFI